MFGLGMWEILIILALALVVIGPKKLPDIAASIGKGLRELRRATDDIRHAVDVTPTPRPPASPPAAPDSATPPAAPAALPVAAPAPAPVPVSPYEDAERTPPVETPATPAGAAPPAPAEAPPEKSEN